MFKDVAVVCDATQAQSSALAYARAVAGEHDPHVLGICLTPDLFSAAAVAVSAAGAAVIPPQTAVQEERQQEFNDRRNKLRKAFLNAFASSAEFRSWTDVSAAYGQLGERAAALVRTRDIALVDAVASPEADWGTIVQKIVLESGRPAIVCPPISESDRPLRVQPQRVLVAWDGSVHAARAVHEALPMLECAAQVRAITVDGAENADEAQDATHVSALKRHLSCHGIKTEEAELEPDGDAAVSDTLIDEGARFDADMTVMGAYGGSFLREMVFGSTTGNVLTKSARPLFLCH